MTKLWVVVLADANHDVHTHLFETWDPALAFVQAAVGPLAPVAETHLEAGGIVATAFGWVLARACPVVADEAETSPDQNAADAIAGLQHLGFTKAKAEAAVLRACAKVGDAPIAELVTESLRQAA